MCPQDQFGPPYDQVGFPKGHDFSDTRTTIYWATCSSILNKIFCSSVLRQASLLRLDVNFSWYGANFLWNEMQIPIGLLKRRRGCMETRFLSF